MLKLTYSETGLELERLTASVETLVSQRTVLALRLGLPIFVQPGWASFLIPVDAVSLKAFKQAVKGESTKTIELCQVDDEYYEISLRGTWIANSNQAHEGMFVAVMGERSELFVDQLWQTTQDVVLV